MTTTWLTSLRRLPYKARCLSSRNRRRQSVAMRISIRAITTLAQVTVNYQLKRAQKFNQAIPQCARNYDTLSMNHHRLVSDVLSTQNTTVCRRQFHVAVLIIPRPLMFSLTTAMHSATETSMYVSYLVLSTNSNVIKWA